MSAYHSPTPWKAEAYSAAFSEIVDAEERVVGEKMFKDDAAYIVRAVNEYAKCDGTFGRKRRTMSSNTKSATVWMLANRYGSMLARGNPAAGRPGVQGPPPYRLVSFLDENDFFMQDIVWARRKWELEETGVQKEWNLWAGKNAQLRVRPVRVRMELEFERKEKNP